MQTLKPILKLVLYANVCKRNVTVGGAVQSSTESTNLKSWREIPGPSSLPIIGILHQFLPGVIGALYLLACNPEKQETLRAEVLAKPDRSPYLKACIKEAMRMMPVASGNIRTTTKDYNLLGYKIPKGMTVIYSHHGMSMMKSQYVRANEFLPERWMTDKDDPLYYKNAHPFAYAPFGFGVRSCVGRRIAELELETLLNKMIKNFRVEWIGPPPQVMQLTINYIKGPYNFEFKDL